MTLKTKDSWFINEEGERILLRGVNLGGSTKVPVTPDGSTHIVTDFSDHRDVSFVGHPFPVDEAERHFERLKRWGFNCLRFLTTWEAIEHKGPGKYDKDYLDYFQKIIEIAGDYDFYTFIDPHQDVWSRMTGGDGAPGWTFEKVGIDFTTFKTNGGAKVMQYHYPENYEQMEWFMNYQRFGTATMFTLFFGSEDFAPNAEIDGKSIQKYLQSHFTEAILEIAKRVKDYDHVIGFDSLNEPHYGYIGLDDLGQFPAVTPPGLHFSPFDAIASGGGYSRTAMRFDFKYFRLVEVGTETLNSAEISSWTDGDIWEDHGIYENQDGEPVLLKPNYFKTKPDGTPVQFFHDYLRPFAIDYIEAIREIFPESLLFIEGDPQEPVLSWNEDDPQGIVNASHWYDGFTLFTKTYRPWLSVNLITLRPIIFANKVKNYHKEQLLLRKHASQKIGGVPTLIGEFGIPYDMNGARAYQNGDFSDQIKALDMYYDLMDELQLHTTQWNYTADNNNKWGDLWNMEDLSIFSYDQQDDANNINSGGRAIAGFCRPYPQKIAGDPLSWSFDLGSKNFEFTYQSSPGTTEVYVPSYQYPSIKIFIEPNVKHTYNPNTQLLQIITETDQEITLKLSSK